MKRALLALVLALSCGLADRARAAQGDKGPAEPEGTPQPNRPAAVEGGTLFAVQPRKFRPGHEFRLAGGFLPQDAFYKGTTADFSYIYHFSDVFSLEVLRAVYSWNHETDLDDRLRSEFNVENDPYEKVQYLFSTHAQITPLYGKHTIANRWIVHQELYFTGGIGGVGWLYHENGRSDRPKNFRPAIDVGVGFRWWMSRLVSVKLEALENLYTKDDGSIDDQVYVSLGLSLTSGRQ